MKFETFNFKKVTSTNDEAINLIRKKKSEYGFVNADLQSKGRGTNGKSWISEKGNFFCSIFFPLKKNYPPFQEFSIINPIIISDIIKSYCRDKKINLKFPNDIFVNKKKICGILQELIVFEGQKYLIIGVGINIVSNPNINGNYQATNIFSATKKKPKIKEIVDLMVDSYENFFTNISSYDYLSFKKKADLMAFNSN